MPEVMLCHVDEYMMMKTFRIENVAQYGEAYRERKEDLNNAIQFMCNMDRSS